MSVDTRYRDFIPEISKQDVEGLLEKDAEYGASWKRRGGVGAFMMAARKFDRLETAVERHNYDVFAAAREDGRFESVLDDIRDLRRYLLLIEGEVLVQLKDENRQPATRISPATRVNLA